MARSGKTKNGGSAAAKAAVEGIGTGLKPIGFNPLVADDFEDEYLEDEEKEEVEPKGKGRKGKKKQR